MQAICQRLVRMHRPVAIERTHLLRPAKEEYRSNQGTLAVAKWFGSTQSWVQDRRGIVSRQ